MARPATDCSFARLARCGWVGRREHLYSQQEDGEESQSAQRRLLSAVLGYVIAILIGLLVPRAAVTLYFFLAVYLIVPFGEMARLLFRRS